MSFIDKIVKVDTSIKVVYDTWVDRMLKASNKSSQELSAKLLSRYQAPNLENARHVYQRGLDIGLIEPFGAPDIWKDVMKTNLYLLTGMPTWSLYNGFKERVFPYMKCSDRPRLFKNLIGLIEYARDINEATWKEYFDILVPHIMNLDLALIDKERMIVVDSPLKKYIVDRLTTLKQRELGDRATKMGPLKDELVATALHPDRIGPFIEKYGPSVTGLF